ncbi:MAG TPA: S8 family serine peptidase [Flavisolibacter sp.]|jgi:subtilisin|nr:S8 family serine peptidase [Flavisolibacter sp.]
MRLIKITILTATVLFYASCTKKDVQSGQASNNNSCFSSSSVDNGKIIQGQYIVSLKSVDASGITNDDIKQTARELILGGKLSASAIKASFTGRVGGFVATLNSSQAEEIKNDPSVKTVEPDRIVALSTCFTVVAPTLITWNVKKVGYGDGRGKTAWIVDSGIDTDHPDLNVDKTRSKSFIPNVTSFDDENGHGTHVAGIIGAKNNDIGVLGIAADATLVSCRVLDKDGNGTLSSIIQALSYIGANAKAGDVINMSVGEDEVSDVLDQQVQAIAAKGIYVAIAAGNDSKAANLFSPGRANGNNIYTVSAVDSLDNFASFSNYGNDVVDFAAPGSRILSTYKGGLYAKMSGTSMATPHVAGLLLLDGRNISYSGTAINDPDGTPDKIAHK